MATAKRNSSEPPWSQTGEVSGASFGSWLKRERELRKVTLREIADSTKISIRYLEALEEERFDILPAQVFARGFLRQYAKYVGLDPNEVVNSYLIAQSGPEDDEEKESPPVSRGRRGVEWTSGVLLTVALLALLTVVAFLAFRAERSKAPESAPETPKSQTPRVEPGRGEAVPTPLPAPVEMAERSEAGAGLVSIPNAALVVTLDFRADCWVEVEVDGRRRLSELHVQGESLQIDARERVVLTLGNPNDVHCEVNGQPYDLGDYPVGRIAKNIEIRLPEPDPGGAPGGD